VRSTSPENRSSASSGKVIVVGVGNRLLGDEGIGPHIIDRLSRRHLSPNVDVIDCGCDLLSLALYMGQPEKIIVIDVIRAGGKPGEIHRFDHSRPTAAKTKMHSAHQVGTVDVLHLLKLAYPVLANTKITVIGVEPKTMELNAGLSKDVKKNIPELIRLVLEEIPAPSHSRQEGRGLRTGVSLDLNES